MKDRIKQLMESMHMNQQTFANHIHIGTATLSSILLGRTKPTLNTVEAIQTYCPTVNLGWLINGVGDMIVTSDSSLPSDNDEMDGIQTTGQASSNGQSMDLFSSQEVGQQASSATMGYPTSPSTPSSNRATSPASMSRTDRQQVQGIDVSMKNIDKYTRHITEIRVYYDDQTWETFVPQK